MAPLSPNGGTAPGGRSRPPPTRREARTSSSPAWPATSSACTAFGLNLTGAGPFTLAERWNGHGGRIQPTPAIPTFDIGIPGVACPTVSSCVAVASYVNNGDPSLTLAEQWTGTPRSPSATGRPAAPGGAAPACPTAPALKFALRANPMPPQREPIARALTNHTSAIWPAQACR